MLLRDKESWRKWLAGTQRCVLLSLGSHVVVFPLQVAFPDAYFLVFSFELQVVKQRNRPQTWLKHYWIFHSPPHCLMGQWRLYLMSPIWGASCTAIRQSRQSSMDRIACRSPHWVLVRCSAVFDESCFDVVYF